MAIKVRKKLFPATRGGPATDHQGPDFFSLKVPILGFRYLYGNRGLVWLKDGSGSGRLGD